MFDPEGLDSDRQGRSERFSGTGLVCALMLVLLGVACWPVGMWLLHLVRASR